MVALMQRITALAKEGRYADAIPLARKLTTEAEKTTGRQSPLTATTYVVLAQSLQAQGELTEAEATLRKALAIREKALGQTHADVAAVLGPLGQIAFARDRLADAEQFAQRAVAIHERTSGPDNVATALARMQLGNVRHRQLREDDAEDIFSRALKSFRAAGAQAEIMVPVALNNLAEVAKARGRLQIADDNFREALTLQEKLYGREHLQVASTLNNLGELRRMQGRFSEAEDLARRALTIRETALGPDHADVAASLNNLAIIFTRQGRASEADTLLTRALAIQQKAFGPDHPNVAIALNNLADAKSAAGQKKDAETLFRRSLAIREKSAGRDHLDTAIAIDNLVTLLVDDNRPAEAEPLARRSLAIREAALGPRHPGVANSLNNLAVVLDTIGNAYDAEPLLKRALEIRRNALGETHPDVANSYNNLGGHYLDIRDWQQAHDSYTRATAILTARNASDTDGDNLTFKDNTNPFPGAIVAAYQLADTAPDQRATLQAQAFEAAQRIGDEQAAKAIAGMSARVAAGGGELSAQVRQRQDLADQALATDRLLISAISQPASARNAQTEQAIRARAGSIAAEIKELDRTIAAKFPDYATLVTRSPVSLTDVQQQLGPKEALLLFSTTERYTFVWTITRSAIRWHAAPLGTKQLTETVRILRCGLDDEAWLGANDCAQKYGLTRPPSGGQLPFDPQRAYGLYQALLAPAAAEIDGKELILVPSGPLATLPFQVLLTEKPPATNIDLAQAPWLAKRFASTVLPSVSSLKALRQVAQGSKAKKPFVGFGNPLLTGNSVSTSDIDRAKLARQFQNCTAIMEARRDQIAQRNVTSTVALAGGTADVEQLKRLAPLPETAIELCAVAERFSPVRGDVYLANAATEANIKSMSDAGQLAQYRVLHFATHGALSGQVRGAIEPGLIMTPPAQASRNDDGYLSSSDISALKLDADWVVLSACNTAGGEKAEAEAFSGLARAFFYAGTRALLVTHWPVNSQAAVLITTGTTNALAVQRDLGRSEAFRRALVNLIGKGGTYAHPSVWAAFVLVGNGGA
ncbi:CHAT domain-containing tetratricopeptide repeat protein [Tardiphaga alba]|nr:CHAT domain-containing tetratricopeptide repeat protein [Tardiphaga alba]